jgi:hypothetical protein
MLGTGSGAVPGSDSHGQMHHNQAAVGDGTALGAWEVHTQQVPNTEASLANYKGRMVSERRC